MTKIPFNLERALAGDLCVDNKGAEYKLVHHSPNNYNYTLLFIKNFGTNIEGSHWSMNDGSEFDDGIQLYMKPMKKTYWVNLYKKSHGQIKTGEYTYLSIEEAIEGADQSSLFKTISFEVEE